MSEIKPCLFCGNGPDDIECRQSDRTLYRVFCWNCDALGPTEKTEDLAICSWNKAHIGTKDIDLTPTIDTHRFELVKQLLPDFKEGNTWHYQVVSDWCVDVADAILARMRESK